MEETVLTGLYIRPVCVSHQAAPVSVLVQPGPQTQERLGSGGHRPVEATGSGLGHIVYRGLVAIGPGQRGSMELDPTRPITLSEDKL